MHGASALDERAERVLTVARAGTAPSQRAVEVLEVILTLYYPDEASLVARFAYDPDHPGLGTTYEGAGTSTRGIIRAGRYFLDNVTPAGLARRVLQFGHELEHVRQQRAGLSGRAHRHEREFLAFAWEATVPEHPGTGRMPHATRVLLIDEALRNYYCMTQAKRERYRSSRDELLSLRAREEGASGNAPSPPPVGCPEHELHD